jgi:putative ABC transport system permease protein
VGDKIPIQAQIYPRKDGSRLWEFTLSGIYDGKEKGTDTSGMFFHYDYLKEASAANPGNVGWYIIRVTDPKQAGAVADRIDAMFTNSPAETKTQSEKAFAQAFADQVGNVGKIATAILTAVFFIMLLVAGNTMAQSVRERTSEMAVLKTLGFTHGQVLGMVLAESCLITVLGGGLGILLAWMMITAGGDPTKGWLPVFYFPGRDLVAGVLLLLLFGLATGLLPAIQAMRLRIVDALRRV